MTKRISEPSQTYDARRMRQILTDIDRRFQVLEKMIGPYTVANYTETRTLDMGTATADDIGNFLATLISDLQAVGRAAKG
jgi:hypothetical protein